jgi:hypothetical protein
MVAQDNPAAQGRYTGSKPVTAAQAAVPPFLRLQVVLAARATRAAAVGAVEVLLPQALLVPGASAAAVWLWSLRTFNL